MVDDKYDIVSELKPNVFVVLPTYEGHQNWLYSVRRITSGYWELAYCEDSKEIGVMPTEGWGWEDDYENKIMDDALLRWRKDHPDLNYTKLKKAIEKLEHFSWPGEEEGPFGPVIRQSDVLAILKTHYSKKQ